MSGVGQQHPLGVSIVQLPSRTLGSGSRSRTASGSGSMSHRASRSRSEGMDMSGGVLLEVDTALYNVTVEPSKKQNAFTLRLVPRSVRRERDDVDDVEGEEEVDDEDDDEILAGLSDSDAEEVTSSKTARRSPRRGGTASSVSLPDSQTAMPSKKQKLGANSQPKAKTKAEPKAKAAAKPKKRGGKALEEEIVIQETQMTQPVLTENSQAEGSDGLPPCETQFSQVSSSSSSGCAAGAAVADAETEVADDEPATMDVAQDGDGSKGVLETEAVMHDHEDDEGDDAAAQEEEEQQRAVPAKTTPRLPLPPVLRDALRNNVIEPETTGPKPCARWGCTATLDTTRNRMIVVGGQADDENESILGDVHSLNLDSLEWQQIMVANLAPRCWHTSTYSRKGDVLLIFGGIDAAGDEMSAMTAFDCQVEIFFPLQTSGRAPTPRSGHSAVMLEESGLMCVFGGCRKTKWYNDVHLFEPSSGHWLQVTVTGEIPPPRVYHSAASLPGDRMIIFGGNARDESFNDAYMLSPAHGSSAKRDVFVWSKINVAGGIPPAPRAGHASVACGTEDVVVFGGWDTNVADGLVEVFKDAHVLNVRTQRWRAAGSRFASDVPHMTGHAALCIGQPETPQGAALLVFGGQGAPPACERFNSLNVVTLPVGDATSATASAATSASGSAPAPAAPAARTKAKPMAKTKADNAARKATRESNPASEGTGPHDSDEDEF